MNLQTSLQIHEIKPVVKGCLLKCCTDGARQSTLDIRNVFPIVAYIMLCTTVHANLIGMFLGKHVDICSSWLDCAHQAILSAALLQENQLMYYTCGFWLDWYGATLSGYTNISEETFWGNCQLFSLCPNNSFVLLLPETSTRVQLGPAVPARRTVQVGCVHHHPSPQHPLCGTHYPL